MEKIDIIKRYTNILTFPIDLLTCGVDRKKIYNRGEYTKNQIILFYSLSGLVLILGLIFS